jgi:protein phosphatase
VRNELEVFQLTSVGDREMNQDCLAQFVSDDYALFVVADGLGGHHAGEKAAQFFCQGIFKQASIYQKVLQNSKDNAKEVLTEWVATAINEMEKLFAGDAKAVDSHTTCVILYLDRNMAATAHCGDSRIYRLNEKKVLWRTKDHSLIQKQLDEGNITERDMGLHPEQNQLTRSINILKKTTAEINIYPAIEKGETFILCTDGFWEFIKEKDLLQLAAPDSGINELKKVAKMMHFRAQGKGDNLTVQWIRCM